MASRSIFGGQAPIYSFPSDFGSSGQSLHTDGAGTLSWGASVGAGTSFTDITVTGDISRTFSGVTQTTSITTAVEINDPTGYITCFDTTASPIIEKTGVEFIVNCSAVSAGDLVSLNVMGHYGILDGFAVVSCNQVSTGSFTIKIFNASPAPHSLIGQLVIGYNITKVI